MPTLMMQRPILILFDMMGTLLRHRESRRPYWYRLGELAETEGIISSAKFNELYSAWRNRRGPHGTREVTLKDRLRQVAPHLSDHLDLLDGLVDTFMAEYEAETELCDGVEEMFEAWSGTAKMGVVSNFFVPNYPERLLGRHGLSDRLDFVIDSAQMGYRKPAREIFLAALERGGIAERDAAHVTFVGDDWIADIEGPRQLGMVPVFYSGSESSDDSVRVVHSWSEFRP